MAIRDKFTTAGGSRAYGKEVRSKFVKGKDGYGKVITKAREALIARNGGKDPGYNIVAAHLTPGSHFEKDGGAARKATRGENTAESNKMRAKFRRK